MYTTFVQISSPSIWRMKPLYSHCQIKSEILSCFTQVQHGLLSGRSTETHLIQVYTHTNSTHNYSWQTNTINIASSKAFDSVPPHLLLHKLRSFGFNGSLYYWLYSYINSRKQRVVINGELSAWCNVTSGVPQGSILGPIIFLLCINHLVDRVSNNSGVALFAYDVNIYRNVDSRNYFLLLENDLQALDDCIIYPRSWVGPITKWLRPVFRIWCPRISA